MSDLQLKRNSIKMFIVEFFSLTMRYSQVRTKQEKIFLIKRFVFV